MKNYVIYDAKTGDISMMIQTDDPSFLALNMPSSCSFISTSERDLKKIEKVDVETKKIRLKPNNQVTTEL